MIYVEGGTSKITSAAMMIPNPCDLLRWRTYVLTERPVKMVANALVPNRRRTIGNHQVDARFTLSHFIKIILTPKPISLTWYSGFCYVISAFLKIISRQTTKQFLDTQSHGFSHSSLSWCDTFDVESSVVPSPKYQSIFSNTCDPLRGLRARILKHWC